MDPTIRSAMERRDAERGEWWLARKDTDPPGKWTLTADPSGDWDWRFKVGSSKSRAVQRIRAAQEAEDRRLLAKSEHEKKCAEARGILLAKRDLADTIPASADGFGGRGNATDSKRV
jgi:hypothetical protein